MFSSSIFLLFLWLLHPPFNKYWIEMNLLEHLRWHSNVVSVIIRNAQVLDAVELPMPKNIVCTPWILILIWHFSAIVFNYKDKLNDFASREVHHIKTNKIHLCLIISSMFGRCVWVFNFDITYPIISKLYLSIFGSYSCLIYRMCLK